jgi:hypothetical protein
MWHRAAESARSDPDHGRSIFLRNVADISPDFLPSQPRRQYCHVFGVPWLIITGCGLDLLALLLQLQSIITARNHWLAKTRSIPYSITSVFSSTVTNDERRITCYWTLLNWSNFEANRIQITTCYSVYSLPRERAYRTVV